MTIEQIIQGLKYTLEMMLYDPSKGVYISPDLLNDLDRITYESSAAALELIETQQVFALLPQYVDCISREEAIQAIYEKYIGGKEAVENSSITDMYAEGLTEAVDAVENLDPIKPMRLNGKWKVIAAENVYECSVCKQPLMTAEIDCYRFCKWCGARMEVENGK